MELSVAATAHDVGLASTIKGLLESAGIEAVLSGSGLESLYPGTTLAEIRILVHEADLPRALEVLDEAEAGALADNPDE